MKNRIYSRMLRGFAVLLAFCALCALASCVRGAETPPEGKKNYVLTVGTTEIAVDADAAPILEALGEWRDYSESNSCAFVGLDKVYTYGGFELQTYPKDGRDYVYMVELYDDSVATREGIAIGASRDAVTKAYGDADQQTDTSLTYTGKSMHLTFLFREDGSVGKIQYWKD